MQIDINSRKQLNKPENYAAFYSLLNRLENIKSLDPLL